MATACTCGGDRTCRRNEQAPAGEETHHMRKRRFTWTLDYVTQARPGATEYRHTTVTAGPATPAGAINRTLSHAPRRHRETVIRVYIIAQEPMS